MSPTIFRYKEYRFFFFSRKEARMHVHVASSEGEAKFWIEPKIELAQDYGLAKEKIAELLEIVENSEMKSKRDGKITSPLKCRISRSKAFGSSSTNESTSCHLKSSRGLKRQRLLRFLT
ncbi:DUF4160 domain-containing protein [Candidatus Acetothermia bacterium]|nr:DUF4160 domain-containing protein [Candidatus Acetothermia bacterium]MBI3643681.1 DUF4160 domain-containing protein [Candidatus Acetothermia bacterium]